MLFLPLLQRQQLIAPGPAVLVAHRRAQPVQPYQRLTAPLAQPGRAKLGGQGIHTGTGLGGQRGQQRLVGVDGRRGQLQCAGSAAAPRPDAVDHRLADGVLALTGWDPGLMITGTAFALGLAYMVRFFGIAQGAVDNYFGGTVQIGYQY